MSEKISKKQYGFSVVAVIVVILVLAGLGYVGYRLYEHFSKPTAVGNANSNNQTNTGTTQTASATNDFKLASNHVSFVTPSGWSASGSHIASGCIIALDSCLDQSAIFPGITGASGGDPQHPQYVGTTIAVYKNDGATTPKDWWDSNRNAGPPLFASGAVDTATETTINGYAAYMFIADAGTYQDRDYIILTKDYVVLVDVELKGAGSIASTAEDYSTYLPAMNSFVNSVKVN